MSGQNLEPLCPLGDMAYRTPAALPFELLQHTGIFFEEKLYTQALTLLFNTLASGTYASKKAVLPLPQHLALAATCLVHPSTTTRAQTAEEKEAANAALRLLRLTSTLVSPRGAKLDVAFSFAHFESTRSGRRRHTEDPSSNNELRDETKALNLELGQSDSLWSRAEDFWHAVGWAFNCSVLHPERWERWQIWLQFMCDVIQADWADREREYEELKAKKDDSKYNAVPASKGGKGKKPRAKDDQGLDIFRGSLIFQYLSAGPVSGRNRRILRAIFADGSATSVNEFRAVFHRELVQSKSSQSADKANKREREVDIDRGLYGDYLSEDETDDEVHSAPNGSKHSSGSTPSSGTDTKARRSKRTRRGTRTATNSSAAEPEITGYSSLAEHRGGVALMGGLAGLGLRKRFIGILSNVADRLPHDFVSILDLYNFFVEKIRPLPLPIFQAFVSPYIVPELADAAQTTLCELLLYTVLESSAPGTDDEYLNQNKLERCFLPFAAASASAVNNAKVSILFEALIVLLAGSKLLTVTPSLKEAVEQGILRRADKAQEEFRRGQNSRNKESLEWCWLVESGERLVFLVDLLQPQS
ncbi:uncharacterized protein N7459_009409 [Penicillium hispanicum]|uniref:uncharacterized protein n=1 Tax=Penicillium hispanicum TaxID=1080232 RepID=UPI0025408A08|nr:uncharacterized protein N7459_009409 [Penicillium hispanicum]KAJ5569979.1 hypothetical protein N7459_009409 [Penicillium hispanicum]